MSGHLRYLSYVIRHKWFVLVAGLKTGAPLWRLLIHDLSKFSPAEWGPYVRYFYGRWKRGEHPPEAVAAFDRAWLHHQHANPHHWQHWLLREDDPGHSFAIVSPDCLQDYALTVYERGWQDRRGERLPEVWLEKCPPNEQGNARLMLAQRIVDAANAAPRALLMPEHFVREMVADWAGAGRAITGRWEVKSWYWKNSARMTLHPETRVLVERVLRETWA